MELISLNGQWQLQFGQQTPDAPENPDQLPSANWPTITASVPGNVELDLQKAGILPDLHIGTNIFALRQYESYRWFYSRQFTAPTLTPGQNLQLLFEGIDCLATIWINNQHLGQCENALIEHRFDITDYILPGQTNSIDIRLDSPLLAGRKRIPEAVEQVAGLSSRWESQSIRKPPHAYGWDIMPRALSAGLWRNVTLQILPPTRLRSVYWFTQSIDFNADSSQATVTVDWDFCTNQPITDDMSVRASLTDAEEHTTQTQSPAIGTHGRMSFNLTNPKLWWPRGYGQPHLYTARLELLSPSGKTLDTHQCFFGIRTVQLNTTQTLNKNGKGAFQFIINNTPVYAKGTNWVPLDAFHSRDRQHLNTALDMLADLNCNMVRCWGGNVYEDARFFEFCDAHGIMVWQDFAFACAVYPQDEAFRNLVYTEAQDVIRRLRNHPSLILWAGNNENDLVQQWNGLAQYQDPNDDVISRRILPDAVRRNDLTRPYLPSSPYISPQLHAIGSPASAMPEDHLWGNRPHYKSPFYSQSPALFVSEIGYHGCPSRQSLQQMLTPDALWPPENNPQWDAKSVTNLQVQIPDEKRIELMTKQLRFLFDATPDNLDDYILASQITQMEAIKFFIEHWRIKPDAGGLLWWNLRDGWTVISDASAVDYYNRKKLAYKAIKRSQADVCIMIDEPADNRHAIIAVNDTRQQIAGNVKVSNATGDQLFTSEFNIEPGQRNTLGHLRQLPTNDLWLINWQLADQSPGRNHYLTGPTPMPLDTYKKFLPLLIL